MEIIAMNRFLARTAASSALALLVLISGGASAQTLQFDLNRGQFGVSPDREERRGPRIIEEEEAGVTCREGRRIVRERGFSDVRPIDCNGRSLVFSARERGQPVEIRISARNGRIVSVEPL
jgi:hypothetical protein